MLKVVKPQIVILLFILSTKVYSAQTKLPDPQQTVDKFLNAWLVKKNFAQVRREFSKEAFSNKLILSDDCAGYIHDNERAVPKRVERQVMKFLRDFAFTAKGMSLKAILAFDNKSDENPGTINLASKDGYFLLRTKRDELPNDDEWSYLKTRFISTEYLSAVVTLKTQGGGKGSLYFHWAKLGNNWKLIHLGMHCI